MAIIRSKIARQLLAEGGAPRRQGYLIGGLLQRAEDAKKANEQALRLLNNQSSSIQNTGMGEGRTDANTMSGSGIPAYDPNELMSFTGSSYEDNYTPEELKLLRTIPVSDYNTPGGGPITQRVRNQIATMRGDPLPYPSTTPTTATPTAEPEPERTGLGRVASIVQKAIQERQPEKSAFNVMMDERGNVMRDQGIPDFLRQMGRGSEITGNVPIRNISDVFRLAGISDQGIGSIGMDKSYEENQAINEQRRLANQRFRSAASDLLARGDSVTNEDIFRFGDRLGVSPEITSKVISGVQSMGLPASLPPPGGLRLEDIDQFGFPRPITQDDIDTFNFQPPGNDPGSFPGGVTLDGRTFQNEQDAIAGLGIERYNQLMATGGRVNLKGGGVSLDTAKKMAPKGEFLAYINPKEAQMLKDAGGSGIMTPMGIPSFFDDSSYGEDMGGSYSSYSDTPGDQGSSGGDDGYGGGDENPRPTYSQQLTTLQTQGDDQFEEDTAIATRTPGRGGIFGSGIGGTDLALAAFAPPIFAVKKVADILGISDPNAKFKNPNEDPDGDGDNDNQIVKPFIPIIPKKPSDITEEQSDFVQRFILPEAYRLRAADGGLASLQPRQELFGGGIVDAVKGAVKGVTGGVKKVLKSDLGKAALMFAAGSYATGLGPFGGLKGAGFLPFSMPSFDSIPGGGATAAIVGTSLLGGLLTSKQPDQDIDALSSRISDQTGIDVAKIRAEVQQAYRDKDTSKLAKKYPFLVPEESALAYDYEKGGRVGFKNGTKENGVKEVEKEKPLKLQKLKKKVLHL